jgi:hypothetical protein
MKNLKKKQKVDSTPIPGTRQSADNQRFVVSAGKSRPQSRALLEEFEKTKSMVIPYKPAKLYSAKGDLSKEWYVQYWYLVPGETLNYKRFKIRFNINRQPTLSERLSYGNELVKFINEKLRAGFNPYNAFEFKNPSSGLTIIQQFTIYTAGALRRRDKKCKAWLQQQL